MNMDERIARINELAKKKKTIGLTQEEISEQEILRREYIDSVKKNLTSQLESIRIVSEDGTLSPLQKKQ